MIVLGLETVTRAGSVALCRDLGCDGRDGDESKTHGERLPGELLEWLREHDVSVGDVDLFAIVSGPGSFTGLRVGMAAIQGLALVANRLVVPVPTLDAIGEGWASQQASGESEVVLVPCLDGQRGEVFASAHVLAPGAAFADAPTVFDARAVTPERLVDDLVAHGGRRPVVCVGNGAMRYRTHFEERLAGVRIESPAVPLAHVAAARAVRRPELAVRPHTLKPVYVRRPDAVLARERVRSGGTDTLLTGLEFARAATVEDLRAVEALQDRTFANAWGVEAIRWELENTDVARLFVARLADGRLVGYCACWAVFDELQVNSLAVAEDWRRRGIGRRVMAFAIQETAAEGVRSATLEVRRSNEAARRLYESLGFRVEAIRRDYYQNPREDALILWHRALAGRAGLAGPAGAP